MGGWLLSPWALLLVSSWLQEAFVRKPGPKRLMSLHIYSSVAKDFGLELSPNQAIFWRSSVIICDVFPSSARALWINKRVSSAMTLPSLLRRSAHKHVNGPATSSSCSWILKSNFSEQNVDTFLFCWADLSHLHPVLSWQYFTAGFRKVLHYDWFSSAKRVLLI